MSTRLLAALAGLTLAGAAHAKEPAPAGGADPIAAAINRHVAAGLAAQKVAPTALADDATFFRRLNLVLTGRIPAAADARAFLADARPDKRARAIEAALASPLSAQHFTTLWRGWLVPEALTNPGVAQQAPSLEVWLLPKIAGNQPFDRVVHELLSAALDGRTPRMTDGMAAAPVGSPLAFYQAKEFKPESLAAATSRLFLGVQLECAQCHDHPSAKWSREQFWGLAAFYAGLETPAGATPGAAPAKERTDRRELTIPNTDRTVPAAFLDDQEPAWGYKTSPRVALANWVVAPGNPFFSRTVVNRYWGYLMGTGIVDPVDDFHDKNLASHPELLADLAKQFEQSGYDVHALVAGICASEPFQRASAGAPPGGARLYAGYAVQGMAPEQLADSLTLALGLPLEPAGAGYLVNPASLRGQLSETFRLSGGRTQTPTSILQALTLMNGNLVGAATDPATSRTLGAVTDLPGLSVEEQIEALYLATLSRPPTAPELARAAAHAGGGDRAKRLGDVLWVLLNSVEFRTVH